MLRPYRKPLVIMTPKSPLRRKITFSALEELTGGTFKTVIGEIDPLKPADVKRVTLCTGKIYWDLLEARREKGVTDTALVRVEQLYPFPAEALAKELRRYGQATAVVWTQEEPLNQGAWFSVRDAIQECLQTGQTLTHSARPPSAAPAGGDYHRHLERHQRVIAGGLGLQPETGHGGHAAST